VRSFLDVVDVTYDEIEELEDHIDDWPSSRTRRRVADTESPRRGEQRRSHHHHA